MFKDFIKTTDWFLLLLFAILASLFVFSVIGPIILLIKGAFHI